MEDSSNDVAAWYNNYTDYVMFTIAVYVHDVLADWSYALAGFLVSTLFGVSPGQS